MIRFACSKCMAIHEVDDGLAGGEVYCRKCGKIMRVPRAALTGRAEAKEPVYDAVEVVEVIDNPPMRRHESPLREMPASPPIKIDIHQTNTSRPSDNGGHFQFGCGMLLVVFGAIGVFAYLTSLDDVDRFGRRMMGQYMTAAFVGVLMVLSGFTMMILAKQQR